MIRIFIYIILVAVFYSCNNVNKESLNSNTNVGNKDSIIYLSINGVQKEFRMRKDNNIDLVKFQKFLIKFSLAPKFFFDTLATDINGDNILESVVSKIENNNGDYTIISTILMNNNVIKSDTLKTNNELAFLDWGSDSIYYRLKPYSSFYDAYHEI